MAGLYGFFCFVFVAVGAVRLKWWGGGLAFFSFSLFCSSFPGGRLSVVGYFVLRYRFSLGIFGTICGFVCNELLIFSYLLQVVQAE
jgi:hypothetical protein